MSQRLQLRLSIASAAKALLPLLAFVPPLYFLFPLISQPSGHGQIDALAPVEVVAERFREPTGVAVDQANAIFVSDRNSGDVFRIVGAEISPVATGLRKPVGLAFNGQGRLLIVEETRGRLLRLETDQRLTVLAERIRKPRWIGVEENGNVYLTAKAISSAGDDDDEEEEVGEVILRLTPQGGLTVWAEGFRALQGIVVHERNVFGVARGLRGGKDRDREGLFQIPILADGRAGAISRLNQTEIKKPFGLVRDRLGAFYVSGEELRLDQRHDDVIAKVSSAGVVTRFASNLREPRGITLDNQANLLVADDRGGTNGRILRFRAPPAPNVLVPQFTRLSPHTVSGTTERNSRIDAFLNDSTTPIQVSTQDGNFQLTLNLLLNAQNALRVFTTAHNGLGLTSSPAEFTIVHDNLSPVISNLQPPSGSFLNNPRPQIRASFSDNLSGVDVGRVEIHLDGLNVTSQAQVTAAGFTFTPQTPLFEGNHTVSVSIFDRAGNNALATTIFTVDVTSPVIANLTPSHGSIVSTARPPIRADFSDNLSGINISSVRILLDGTDVTSQAAISASGFTLNPASSLSQGSHTVAVSVSDRAGNSASASSTFTVSLGPQLGRIGDRTVNLGETLTFTVSASNPGGGPLSLFVSPLPLPNHATFNAATGLFTFTPDTTQVGKFQLTFSAVSGAQSVSETITITVPSPLPGGLTAVRGRIYNLNNTPLGNVRVTLKATGHTAFSTPDGFFTITGIPSGRQELIINGRAANLGVFAILAVPVDLIEGVLNNLPSPITLPDVDVDAEVQVSAVFNTVVSNPHVPGVALTILGGTARNPDGTLFTGKLSINPVPDYGRPESRPEELRPGMAITIQPAGVRFNPPARLTFPNADNMPAGSELNLWSLSPDTGTFNLMGKGVVTADRLSIITTEGGVSASAWHFFLAPSGSSNTDVDESPGLSNYPDKECTPPAGSSVALQSGCLGVDFSLPSHRSLGVSRPLRFVYKSNRANPQPVIPFNATIAVRAAVPPKLSYSLSVGGVEQGTETFINTSGLDESRDETIRAVASFDASQLKTGVYPYRIKLTSNYLNSAISSFIADKVLVVNEQKSPFGAGWGIEGLGRLHFNTDRSLAFIEGNGTAIFFSGGPNSFIPPLGDFSTLIRNADGTFTRTLKDGTRINFNAQGLQASIVDRNNNRTIYSYDGSERPISISDPAGLLTTLSYTGNLLSSVTDPSGRRTNFTHDSAGDLLRVSFPDGSFKSFGYDSRHLMTAETNERGLVFQREYDRAGRLIRATLPDGSIRTATSAQSVGFVDLSTGVGTITNPAPVVRPSDALSTYRDGRGNQQTVKIGKSGAPLRITDPLNQTTQIERSPVGNDGTLQGGTTFARGQVAQAFSLDGVDDFVQLRNDLYNPFPATGFTYAFWINPFDIPPGRSRTIVSNHQASGNWWNGISLSDQSVELILQNVATGQTFAWVTMGTLSPNSFQHLAVVYKNLGNQATDAAIYINGSPQTIRAITAVGSPAYSPAFTPGHNPSDSLGLAIGRLLEDTPRANFNGLMDEVQFYSRALSAAEVQAIFTAGNTGNRVAPPPGLVSWWAGDGDARDSTGGHGLPTRITRSNGAVVSMSYDSRGNLLSSTDPVGANTTFTYEPNFNQVTSIRDSRGNTTNISYDARGNPTEIRDALGNRTQMTYDSRGLLSSVTSAVGTPQANTTSLTYDAKGNLLTTTDPLGNITTLGYDSAGNVVRSTDGAGRVTEFTYDALNRLISVLDPDVRVIRYQYDAKGNLTQVTDARSQRTTFAYDSIDRLISSTNPLGLRETFSYDADGNLTSTTNRNGQTITFNYDAINRLLSKTLPGNQVTAFRYDSVGNLTSVIDPDSSVTNAYDLANRLTSTTASSPSMPAKTIPYTYDPNGNRLTMTDPQGGVTNYVYDALNRLTSLRNPSGRTTPFNYDALGRRTSMTHANGVVTNYSYDAASQLTRLAHQQGATTLDSFDYTYDRVGNRRTKVDRNGNYGYTYDNLNRLTQAINPLPSNPLETYQYDLVGNRTNSNQNGASMFNQANQLTEDANFTYQYDANGNLTRKIARVGGAFTSYEYDAENKLARVVTPGRTVNYKYDGLGRRIEKEIIEVTTTVRRYVYDNEDILLELDGSNNIISRYTHGPGIDEPLSLEKGGVSFFYHADGLGSITEITDQSGAVAQRYTYSSFGKIESQLDSSFVQPYTFTAREFDSETGLHFYRARAYDPVSGRFTQQDPLRDIIFIPESLNPYLYVANNPVNFRDPFGLARCGCTPKTFGERFAKNLTETNEAFGFPVSSIRNLVTAGATARALDTVTLGRFIFSGLQRLPTGVAPAFGASPFFSTAETAILAGTTTLINAALNFAAFETGAAVGSLINAAFLQDECGESLLFRSPDDR